MAARKKAKRKAGKRAGAKRVRKRRAPRRAAPKRRTPPGDLVLNVARQMAGVVERGLERTLKKLPGRSATAAARQKLKDAIAALRRQAEAIREQAESLANRGAEGPAGIWRPLADKLERAASELGRRLGR